MTLQIKMATVAIFTLFLAACNQEVATPVKDAPQAEESTPVTQGEIIATVNGAPITEETLTMITQANRGAKIPREKLIDDLIKHELLFQEAERKNLKNSEEIAKRLMFVKRSILSQAAMQDFIANTQISDAAIQQEYDKQVAGLGMVEYKARHILTKEEDRAKEAIKKLTDGGKFEDLAKEYSIGPTGSKGGDLGWFSPKQMVAPFSAAVALLKNGEFTQQPVKSQFGWHVILRENSREKTPPPIEKMKPNIQAGLRRQAIEAHLESLRASAEVVIVEKKPEPPVAPVTIPKATSPSPATEVPVPESADEAQTSTPPTSTAETSSPKAGEISNTEADKGNEKTSTSE